MYSTLSILTACGLVVSLIGIIGTCVGDPRSATGHHAPTTPFTVSEAHRAMQLHRGCRADACPRKGAAFRTLVAAGRIVPDTRADGYST